MALTQEEIMAFQPVDVAKARAALQTQGIKNLWEGGGAFTQILQQQQQLATSKGDLQNPNITASQANEARRLAGEAIQQIQGLQKALPQDILQGAIGEVAAVNPDVPGLAPDGLKLASGEQKLVEMSPEERKLAQDSGLFTAPTSPIQTFSGGNRTTPSIVDFLGSVGQPNDFASRSALAQKANIANYTGTASQNTALLNMLRGKTPPTPAPLSEDTLDGAEKDIDTGELPEGTPSDKYGASAEADRVIADIENKKKILDKTDSKLQDKNEELLLEQMENIAGIEGRAKLKAELEQEKLDPLDAEIDSLTVELQTLKNEKDRLLVEQRGKRITMASIIGSQAQISAVMDSKILGISGMIDALNGNYERAEKSIQRAIDAEFGPAEEKIAINKAQVEALKNSGLLTRDEEIQADAITAEKDRQEQVLADQKAEKKDIQGLLVDYIKAGGKDPNVIERIRNSKSFDDALVELGENFPTKSTGGGSGAGGTGLTPTKLATARANFLNDNPNNTLADFDALSDDDKLRWSTGGPDTGGIPGVAEIEDIIIQYQEAGYTQKEIESQMKSDTGLDDLPTPYRQALDNSFPKAGLLGQGGFVDRVTDFFRG